MKKMYWILRAALYLRRCIGGWSDQDLRFCWQTAEAIYFNEIEANGFAGDWRDAVDEELSCWSE
ncbi:hypothetical protein [Pseudomonas rhizophila]